MAADYQPYQVLYQQILVAIEPMVHLPFDLSIDFESRVAAEKLGGVAGSEQDVETKHVTSSPSNDTRTEASVNTVS